MQEMLEVAPTDMQPGVCSFYEVNKDQFIMGETSIEVSENVRISV
jgi:hypothetical protein